MEVVHPDMMEINAELHSQLELLEEELRNTRELARSREEGQGAGQEVERLRAQVVAEQNRAAQEKNKAQEMGKVVNYLEKENGGRREDVEKSEEDIMRLEREDAKEGVGKEEEAREKGPEHRTVKLKVLATYQSIPSTPPSSLRILLSS